MIDLDQLQELEKKATPGPWFQEDCKYQWDLYAVNHDLEGTCPIEMAEMKGLMEQAHPWKLISANKNGYWSPEADAELIPAMRNALPDLLAELTALRAIVGELAASGWHAYDCPDGFLVCPYCRQFAKDGHKANCLIRKAQEAIQ